MPRERTDAGTFAETVTLDAVREVFDQVRGPVVTSSDVAGALDCTNEAARQKLTRLYDREEGDKRKTGRTVVYWRTGDSAEGAGSRPPRDAEEPAQDDADLRLGKDTNGAHAGVTDDEDLRATVRDALAGSGDLLERRVDAILAMYAHLREHGGAENDDLLDAVDVDATGYADAESVWSNMVKGKDTLRALPGVQKPSPGKTTWRYDPEGEGRT